MEPKGIRIEEFNYDLPDERIAKHPLAVRDACKLLVWRDGMISETVFSDVPDLLPRDAVLVYNNTRVINARLRFRKDTGANIEIFCLEPVNPSDYARNFAATSCCDWLCFVGNSKKWKDGRLYDDVCVDNRPVRLSAERIAQQGNAWVIRFCWDGGVNFSDIISSAGEIPVPPYLNRPTEKTDAIDYQTVYSHVEGSVAAPTAGLHFTSEILEKISEYGIPRLEVTLHVGAGTFQPVKSESIGEHPMHSEFIAVERSVIAQLAEAVKQKRPVVAVGTTSVRTLESLYHAGCLVYQGDWNGEVPQWYPYETAHPSLSAEAALSALSDWLVKNNSTSFIADTRIIIVPGYQYKVVSGMITNFHQPRSTLLLLVSAFTGGCRWRQIYEYALSRDFRFLSYGDACLLLKDNI